MTPIIATDDHLFLATLSKRNLRDIVLPYLGELFVSHTSTLLTLREHNEAGKKRVARLPPSDFLVDEWGLTGVCLGYALESVSWVERFGHWPAIPRLMEGRPNETIRHLERLLILAVYQALDRGMDPKKIVRAKGNAVIIDQIVKNYAYLQRRRTGIILGTSFPGPNFCETEPMSVALANFEKRCIANPPTEKDHFIFLIGKSEILNLHVIYVNPALGIIADAASGLMWKMERKVNKYFHQALAYFTQIQGYQETSIIHLTKEARSKTTPLLMSRVVRRTQTVFRIGYVSGPRSAFKYLQNVHQHNPLVRYFSPKIPKPCINEICWLFLDHQYEKLYQYMKENLDGLFQIEHEMTRLEHNIFLLVEEKKDEKKALEILDILIKIHALGPKVEAFSLYFHERLLKTSVTRKEFQTAYPPHIINIFIPKLLELRQKSKGKKYCLLEVFYSVDPCLTQLPFYALLFKHGVDPKRVVFTKHQGPIRN